MPITYLKFLVQQNTNPPCKFYNLEILFFLYWFWQNHSLFYTSITSLAMDYLLLTLFNSKGIFSFVLFFIIFLPNMILYLLFTDWFIMRQTCDFQLFIDVFIDFLIERTKSMMQFMQLMEYVTLLRLHL